MVRFVHRTDRRAFERKRRSHMFEYRGLLDRPPRDIFGWEDVFRGFDRFFREVDREITSFGYAPSEVREEDGAYVLRLEAPGLTEKDVKVDLNGGVLTISAARPVDAPKGYEARRRERAELSFSRSFVLGEKIDPEKTVAEMKDGVLTVKVPKAPGLQRKTIAVKAS
jgi:HSP20 family protein